jgi:hypothetical protein
MPCGQKYVMEGLSGKTVLLVTHQVGFLPAFDSILVGISVKLCCSLKSLSLIYIFIFWVRGYFLHCSSHSCISFSKITACLC